MNLLGTGMLAWWTPHLFVVVFVQSSDPIPRKVAEVIGWPALSDGRTGEGVVGRFLMVLKVFGSC